MRAVAPDAELAAGAPDLAAQQVGRALDDDAGPVAAGRAWPHRVGHGAQCCFDVARIDAGAADLDHRGLRPGLGARRVRRTLRGVECSGPTLSTPHGGGLRLVSEGGVVVVMAKSPLLDENFRRRRAQLAEQISASGSRGESRPPSSSTMSRALATIAALLGASTPRER